MGGEVDMGSGIYSTWGKLVVSGETRVAGGHIYPTHAKTLMHGRNFQSWGIMKTSQLSRSRNHIETKCAVR